MEDGFTTVSSNKKGRSRRKPRAKTSFSTKFAATEAQLEENGWLDSVNNRFTEAALRLGSSPISAVTCLGLGSPTESANARAQLALLLSLCRNTSIKFSNVQIHDPVFTEEDIAALSGLGFTDIGRGAEGSYAVDQPTLFFMPHCEMDLYENVLKDNWTNSQLPMMLLLSNRFSEYIDKLS